MLSPKGLVGYAVTPDALPNITGHGSNETSILPAAAPEGRSACAEFALPLTSIVAFVDSRPSVAADAMLASNGPANNAITPDASPDKAGRISKEFFTLPADARSAPQSLLLASHPLPTNMSDSHSDADSPLGSPVSTSNRPPFSPFTEVMGGPRWI